MGSITKILRTIIRCLIMTLSGLQFSCCGDIWSDSPSVLLETNEHVFLGRLVSQQSVLDLGTVEHYGTMTHFAIFEYGYVPLVAFKGSDVDTISMWVCHRMAPAEKQNFLPVTVGDSVLVYGNEIVNRQDLIRTMNAITRIDTLIRFLETARPGYVSWNTLHADTTLISRIRGSNALVKAFKQRNLYSKVLHPTDLYMWTTQEFLQGNLCYKSKNWLWDTTANRQEYLAALADASAELAHKELSGHR